ncbi:MAG: c-type cytochrome [Cytophagales bacterium]|nr:c-type cytochrome [Cytophagales bacterium]
MSIKPTYMPKPYHLVAICMAIFFSTPVLLGQESDSSVVETDSAVMVNDTDDVFDPNVVSAGKELFDNQCAVCHQMTKRVVGPALAGISDRLEEEWLITWIRNSQQLIGSGDEYANQIFNDYSKLTMQAFDLSDSEIKSILTYIKSETANGSAVEDVVAVSSTTSVSVPQEDGFFTAVVVMIIFSGFLILVLLILIRSVITKHKKEKHFNEHGGSVIDLNAKEVSFLKSNAFLGLVVFIFTAIALKTLIDGAFSIGVQQGYQPTQPINYSHKVHAGDFEIDCNYCHTGVKKSRSANIPSPNICMNCHTDIKNVGGQDGISPEISKIYAAVDYNPDTREYGTNTKPIEWVRVHNLPDLAYFNHSQHVDVAEMECQTCHGPIQEMDVVYQYSNLTMGWCINCHRETDVNTKGNGYYDNLVELHNEKSKEPMKVEDIGGLECAKCHY